MDMTEKYAQMCEQSKELQEQWKPQAGYFYTTREKRTGIVKSYDPSTNLIYGIMGERLNRLNVIGLFSQDYLQEIVFPNNYNFHISLVGSYYRMNVLDIYGNTYNFQYGESMEQIWIAFVMYEKYGKSLDNGSERWLALAN